MIIYVRTAESILLGQELQNFAITADRGLGGRNDIQELEKILEEIDIKITQSMWRKREGLFEAENIIRKHMNDNNLCGECSRRKWHQIGYKDGKDDGWISVEERLPTKEECKKDNNEFLVQTDAGERFSCEYDPLANGFDNPLWRCNVPVVAWRPLPETYHPERSDNHDEDIL